MAETTFIWQQKGTPRKGVGIYHVTASAVVRDPVKAAFGELKWTVRDEQIEEAHVEWTPLGPRIWDCQ